MLRQGYGKTLFFQNIPGSSAATAIFDNLSGELSNQYKMIR
jgi:hypothetical protein